MISLSKLIKSAHAFQQEDAKKSILLQTIDFSPPSNVRENPELPVKAKVFLQQASEEAEMLVQKAKAEAKNIRINIEAERQQWNSELEMQKEEARQDGYLAGLNAGKEEGYMQYISYLEDAREIVQQSKEDYIGKILSAEETIVKLAVKLAEKLIFIEMEEHPEWFLELVKKAINEVREYPEIKIFVHPIHYGHVLKQKNELENMLMSKSDLFIFPDDALPEGSCQIESPFGKVDAGIDVQLQQLKQQMLELVGEE
jgi:flagellar assembly protein FliH